MEPGRAVAAVTQGVSSGHPGGASALFVDGSVHFLTDSFSPRR